MSLCQAFLVWKVHPAGCWSVQPDGNKPMMMSLLMPHPPPTTWCFRDRGIETFCPPECGAFKSIISRKVFCEEQESAREMKSCCENTFLINTFVPHRFIAVFGSFSIAGCGPLTEKKTFNIEFAFNYTANFTHTSESVLLRLSCRLTAPPPLLLLQLKATWAHKAQQEVRPPV